MTKRPGKIIKASSVDDIPDETINFTRGYKTPRQDAIYEFIKKHPNCTRKDIYSLPFNEGDIRKSLTAMLKSNKLKETFTIR